MSRFPKSSVVLAALLLSTACALAAPALQNFSGIGRPATTKEVKAWDIDVRPDFRGLPAGSGSVAKGQDVWESKCAMCHGIFGESNEVFSPLVGGTTKEDVASGRVARLTDEAYPQRTTLMKVPTLSTLWDYINRAMPWNSPKSLSVEEVYAVTAFLLNLGGILPDDFVMSDKNIAEVQKRMPNRNGITLEHGMWPGKLKGTTNRPDVQGSGCMKNCVTEAKIASFLPDHARNAHGNLADQNRIVGPQHGAVTASEEERKAQGATAAAKSPAAQAAALLAKHSCVACHSIDAKLVGPAFRDVARKYGGKPDAVVHLSARIKSGGSGLWGPIPMPAQSLSEADAQQIASWLASGAAKP